MIDPHPLPDPFDIRLESRRECLVVVPHGELDVATSGRLAAALDEQFSNGADHVVADLRELSFIDSTGIRTLWSVHQRAERDGVRLSLIAGTGTVHRALRVTGLLERLHLVEQ